MIEDKKLENIIEGILFLSGNMGVTIAEISITLNIDDNYSLELLENLKLKYKDQGGLDLINTSNTYKLVTKDIYYDYYKKYANLNFEAKLGKSTLEVLAIISYKQPVTKYEIEELKGVNTNYHLSTLINRGLIYVSGKKKEIGTPNLFSTTPQFLDFVGINSLEEMPDLRTFQINSDSNILLNFEEFNFQELSEQLLSEENTIEVKQLDQGILEELKEIENIKIHDVFNIGEENGETTKKDSE